MFTRVNFLLGFGFLVMLGFYFVFSYVLILPLAAFAQGWVKPVAGVAVLASVGFTVQILSIAMSKLAGVASYKQGPDALAIASQAALVCGHGAMGYATAVWFGGGSPPALSGLALIAALYATGVGLGVVEWRQRRAAAP